MKKEMKISIVAISIILVLAAVTGCASYRNLELRVTALEERVFDTEPGEVTESANEQNPSDTSSTDAKDQAIDHLKGIIVFNGAPFRSKSTPVLSGLRNRDDDNKWIRGAELIFEYDGETGAFAISSLPEANLLIWLYFPENAGDQMHLGGQYLLDAERVDYKDLSPAERTDYELKIQQVIHLTLPVDNGSKATYNSQESNYPEVSGSEIAWDPVEGAEYYQLSVARWRTRAHRDEIGSIDTVLSERTADNSIAANLPPSGENEYYRLAIQAYDGGEQVAQLMGVFENGYGWTVDFIVGE